MELKISFIIPTFNEEKNIERLLLSIKENVADNYSYEIIIVDNGSTDNTVAKAKRYGKVYTVIEKTIGFLRNYGAKKSSGFLIVFLDGDVYLKPNWGQNIGECINELSKNPLIVTGSRCGISENPTYIEKYWFKPLIKEKGKYINSAHLIVTRELFDKINGFSDTLETGEDYDFSQRAVKAGAIIYNNPKLEVIHVGYPKDILSFVKREVWHGKEDYRNFKVIIKSRVSIISILFGIMHIFLALSAIWKNAIISVELLVLISITCLISSLIKYKRPASIVLRNAILYYIYFSARAFAFIVFLCSTKRINNEN